jgi:hypothetical protein
MHVHGWHEFTGDVHVHLRVHSNREVSLIPESAP